MSMRSAILRTSSSRCSRPRSLRAITAARRNPGTSCCNSSKRLAINSAELNDSPVALPPGCARVLTIPAPTGSPTPTNTIGIVALALLAASVAGVPCVTSICTPASISSRAISTRRSAWSSPQRSSSATSPSSAQPSVARPPRNASRTFWPDLREPGPIKPICAILRAASAGRRSTIAAAPNSNTCRRPTRPSLAILCARIGIAASPADSFLIFLCEQREDHRSQCQSTASHSIRATWACLLLCYPFVDDVWRGRECPLHVQGSGLEGAVGAEIGDDGGRAEIRSVREAQIFLVIVRLKQQIVSAIAVDVGILRLPGRKAAAELPPFHRRAEPAGARARQRYQEAVVERLEGQIGNAVTVDIGIFSFAGEQEAAMRHTLNQRAQA